MSGILVKICVNTSVGDLRLAEEAGADYVGIIVDHPPSPRHVALEDAVALAAAATRAAVVAVTVNLSLEHLLRVHETLKPAVLQLHGDEPLELVAALKARGLSIWGVAAGEAGVVAARAADLAEAGCDAVLLDVRATGAAGTVYGGTGQVGDWDVARALVEAGRRVVLAGGLTPDNVAAAIQRVRPWVVDVASGVEAAKGRKDPEKVRAFIAAARAAG